MISQLTREEMKHKTPQGSSSQNVIIIGKFEHHVAIWGTDVFIFLKERSPPISYPTCQKKNIYRGDLSRLPFKCLQVHTQGSYKHKREKSLLWGPFIQIILGIIITYLLFLRLKHLKSYTKQEWVTVVN